MEILNMSVVVNKNMFCEHIVAATIAKYYKRNFEFGFVRSMNIFINDNEKSPFNQLEYNRSYFLDDLAQFHGIRIENFIKSDLKGFIEAGHQLEYGSIYPEILYSLYFNNGGPYLFIGKNKKYVFLDIHKSKEKVEFNREYIERNMCGYSVIRIENEEFLSSLNAAECNIKIKEKLLLMKQRNERNKNIFYYIQELSAYKNCEELYDNYEDTKFSNTLTHIFAGRIHFYYFLEMLYRQFNLEKYNYLANKVLEVYHLWTIIWSLFYKYILSKNLKDNMDKIGRKMAEVLSIENDILESIQNITEFGLYKKHLNSRNSLEWSERAMQLDLNCYYNNTAFADPQKPYVSGLYPREGYDEFLDIRKFYPFPVINNIFYSKKQKFDNICCMGQEIKIPGGVYSKIAVAGCCFPGGYSEKITLNMHNKKRRDIEIGLSDIHSTIPTQGDHIIYRSGLGVYSEGLVRERYGYEGHLFLYEEQFGDYYELTNLVLPNFPFMHIFSIIIE